jgi:hypothetical protein
MQPSVFSKVGQKTNAPSLNIAVIIPSIFLKEIQHEDAFTSSFYNRGGVFQC